jgi:hypothetical protein
VVEPEAEEAEDTSEGLAEQDDHEEPEAEEAEPVAAVAAVEREPEQQQPQTYSCTVRVRVRGPGGVIAATGVHQAGDVVRMSRAEAESLGDAVEIQE